MRDLIQIVRRQLALCLRLLELIKAQQSALINTAAADVRRLTKEIETVIIDLNGLEGKRQDFLQKNGGGDAAAWVSRQPAGPGRDMAARLLAKQAELLQKLKEESGNSLQYLNKNMEYINYNMNVMTQTAAGVTYGAPGGSGGRPVQGDRMFEAGV